MTIPQFILILVFLYAGVHITTGHWLAVDKHRKEEDMKQVRENCAKYLSRHWRK